MWWQLWIITWLLLNKDISTVQLSWLPANREVYSPDQIFLAVFFTTFFLLHYSFSHNHGSEKWWNMAIQQAFGSFGFVSVRAKWMNQKSVRFRFVFPRFVSWRANWWTILIAMGMGSTRKSCVQRWKVSVGGWTSVWVQPRKVVFRDESHQRGVEPWVWVQPRKVGFRDERYQWGVEPRSEFNPEKLCSEMKGNSGGLNQDVGPSSTPKSRVQRWKVSVGGWTSVWVQPRKVVFRDER